MQGLKAWFQIFRKFVGVGVKGLRFVFVVLFLECVWVPDPQPPPHGKR